MKIWKKSWIEWISTWFLCKLRLDISNIENIPIHLMKNIKTYFINLVLSLASAEMSFDKKSTDTASFQWIIGYEICIHEKSEVRGLANSYWIECWCTSYYLFFISVSRCDRICNTVENLFGRIYVTNKMEDMNMKVFDMIKEINIWKTLTKQIS